MPYDDVNILTSVIDEINSSYEIKIDKSLKMMIPNKNVDKLFVNKI